MHEEFLKRMEKDDLCYNSKKWDNWTKEQDQKLFKLVEIYNLDQIKLVTKHLNDFIMEQKLLMPDNLEEKVCIPKNENDCTDRYFLLKTGDDGVIK